MRSGRQSVENLEVWRNDRPGRTIAGEDRDRRTEVRRVVEGTGVDRERVVLADLAAEDQAAADDTGIAHGVAASGGLRYELSSLTAEAYRVGGKPHERDEARAGRA